MNKAQSVFAIKDCLTIKYQRPKDSSISILIVYNQIYRSNIKPGMTDQVYYQAKDSRNYFQFESFVNQTSAEDVRTYEIIQWIR